MTIVRCVLLAGLLALPLRAQNSWQSAFAKMPLTEKVTELNRHNCARIFLNSFQSNSAVQALIFMPGATDELYFFRRAHARLTNDAPTLLDAIVALTNQTYIQAAVVPPFLVLHTVEDWFDTSIDIQNNRMAERIKRKKFEPHAIYDDRDWNYLEPILAFDINTRLEPGLHTHESNHFFRCSFAEYGLNGWDAMRAVAMASKTKITVKRWDVVFSLDTRMMPAPPNLKGDFLFNPDP